MVNCSGSTPSSTLILRSSWYGRRKPSSIDGRIEGGPAVPEDGTKSVAALDVGDVFGPSARPTPIKVRRGSLDSGDSFA